LPAKQGGLSTVATMESASGKSFTTDLLVTATQSDQDIITKCRPSCGNAQWLLQHMAMLKSIFIELPTHCRRNQFTLPR
jgi:hypothetical protein